MSQKYPGGLITKSPITPSGPYETSTASGIWTLDQQAYWQKLGQWPTAGRATPDPQFNYVTMLLHGDGTNGAQNNTFLDSSTNNFTITRNGNTTQGSFSPYGSNWSNFFDGTGDYLSIADNAALDLSTLDFTIECWVFPTTGISDVDGVISKRSTSTFDGGDWRIAYSSANTAFGLAAGSNNTDRLTPTITLNAWNHIAFVRESGTLSCYANGTRGANLAWTTNLDNAQPLLIGLNVTGYDFPGYISNVRIVKGTAVYSGSTYTVPTTPLTAITNTSLLTCQSNRFIDNSASPLTITVNGTPSVQRFNPFGTSSTYSTSVIGGSGYFDGSGDYLNTPSTSQLTAAGDFTVSCWFYLQSFANSYYVVGGNWDAGASDEWLIQIANTGAIRFLTSAGTSFSSTGVVKLNQWTYFTATRSGTTVTVQLNGTTVSTYTKSDTLGAASKTIYIGQQSGNNWPFNGYISDFRLLSGSAITTVPTAPVSSTSTGLLLSMTNGAIYDNAMMNDLETVGNAQISTSVVKYGTGSLKFDGTGDWLKAPSNPNFIFNGNFTIECWFYPLTLTGNQGIFASSGERFGLIRVGSSIYWLGTPDVAGSSGTLTNNTWQHIAVSRSSGTLRLFVNGVLDVSGTTTQVNSQFPWYVGANQDLEGLNGYIDDIRITKGYARYTANFTPPTAAFSNIGPT